MCVWQYLYVCIYLSVSVYVFFVCIFVSISISLTRLFSFVFLHFISVILLWCCWYCIQLTEREREREEGRRLSWSQLLKWLRPQLYQKVEIPDRQLISRSIDWVDWFANSITTYVYFICNRINRFAWLLCKQFTWCSDNAISWQMDARLANALHSLLV